MVIKKIEIKIFEIEILEIRIIKPQIINPIRTQIRVILSIIHNTSILRNRRIQ